MPRPPRIWVPDGLYHVTSKAVDERVLFYGPADFSDHLQLAGAMVGRHSVICHAFCLMTTHTHFLLRVPDDDLSEAMHWLNTAWARQFNRRYGLRGHVFADRFAAKLIENESHLLEVYRYIARQPVEAGMRERPEYWPWSSYAAAIGLARKPWLVEDRWVLEHLGDGDVERGRERLRRFVEDGLAAPRRRAA